MQASGVAGLSQHEQSPQGAVEKIDGFCLSVDSRGVTRAASKNAARIFQTEVQRMIGAPLATVLQSLGQDWIALAQAGVSRASSKSRTLRHPFSGKLFEVSTFQQGGVLDIIARDVTSPEWFKPWLDQYAPSTLNSLSNEELSLFKVPADQEISMVVFQLRGLPQQAESYSSGQLLTTVTYIWEELSQTLDEHMGTLCYLTPHQMVAVFGTPRQTSAHSLQAFRFACMAMNRIEMTRARLASLGRPIPHVRASVCSGRGKVGLYSMGKTSSFEVVGHEFDISRILTPLAQEGEILASETSVRQMVAQLPQGLERRAADPRWFPPVTENAPTSLHAQLLPEGQRGQGFSLYTSPVGEGSVPELCIQYLYTLHPEGGAKPMPVARVFSPKGIQSGATPGPGVPQADERKISQYVLVGQDGVLCGWEMWKARDGGGRPVRLSFLKQGTLVEEKYHHVEGRLQALQTSDHKGLEKVLACERTSRSGVIIVSEPVSGALPLYALMASATEHADSPGSIQQLMAGFSKDTVLYDESGASSRTARLSIQQTLALLIQVADAISNAHSRGQAHGALSPWSIWVDADARVSLCDFAMSAITAPESMEALHPYRAPEADAVTEQSDIYSVGAVLYQLLTGVTKSSPSSANSPLAKEIRMIRQDVPASLAAVCEKALHPTASRRYESMSSLKNDLLRIQKGEAPSVMAQSGWTLFGALFAKHAFIFVALSLITMGVVAGMILYIQNLQSQLREVRFTRNLVEKRAHLTEMERDRLKENEGKLREKISRMKLEYDVLKGKRPAGVVVTDSEDHFTQAKEDLLKQDYEGALQKLSTVVNNDPYHADAWYIIGQIHIATLHIGEARNAFEKAQKIDNMRFAPSLSMLNSIIVQYNQRINAIKREQDKIGEEEASRLKREALKELRTRVFSVFPG